MTFERAGDPPAHLERFTAGDPLRGLAALAIVIVHAAYPFAFEPGGIEGAFGNLPARFLLALPVAVNVFFVLSGYLIARPFVRAYLDGAPLPRVGRYLRNRALRIVPAYWAVLTVLLLLHGPLGSSALGVAGTYAFLENLFLIPARGLFLQTWSVIVEVGFYLFIPVVALVLGAVARRLERPARLRLLAVALAGAWIASALVRNTVATTIGPFDKLQLTLPAFLWSFIPGIALATIELSAARARLAAARASRLLPAVLLALALAGYAVLMAMRAAPEAERSIAVIVFATLVSGALVAAPLTRQWSGRPAERYLDNRPLRWVGTRSYSLYLVHVAVLDELRDPILDVASGWAALGLLVVAALPASLLLAHIGYELVELPFLRRRLPWRRPAREAVTAS